MSERMSDCMPECQIESQKNKYAIYTSRWYVRNYVRIAFKGGTYSKKAFIPECVAKGSRFTLVWGLRFDVFARRCFCVRKCPQPTATDRNRPQPFGSVCERPSRGQHGRAYSEFCKAVILRISNVAYLCLAWQGWHFVTDVSYGVQRRFA